MADNVTLDPGTGGAEIAADDVSSVYFQKIKLDAGGDGLSVPIIAGRQLDAASIPVALSSEDVALLDGIEGLLAGTLTVGSHAVTNAGTFAVQVSSIAAGTNAIGKLAANSGVDIGDVDVTSVPTDPFGANADAASATGSISAKLRFIAATGIPITSLPALAAGTNAIGKLASNTGVTIGAVEIASAQTLATVTTVSTVTALTGGGVAHDGADSGNPVKVGAKAIAALSGTTLVTAADRTDAQSDLDGALLVRADGALGDYVSGNASNTDGSSTQVLAAGAAGVKHYITDVTITNTSASNIYVELKDNTTVKWTFPVPANGGVTHHFRTPLAGTAATAWNFDPSAAATTVYCSVSAFKSKI